MFDQNLPDVTCVGCGKKGGVVRMATPEAVDVRGVRIVVTKVSRTCHLCRACFENSTDPDWRLDAYAAYRAAAGWTSPEEIRTWRTNNDLGQEEAALLLGCDLVTLGRIEKGSLQTPELEAVLVTCIEITGDDATFERHIEEVPGRCGGRPTLKGRRIEPRHIAGSLLAGDNMSTLMGDYRLTQREVVVCYLFHKRHPAPHREC